MLIKGRTGKNNPRAAYKGKTFACGSGMHHTIHCFGSKFTSLMVYFLSNLKIRVHTLPAHWLTGGWGLTEAWPMARRSDIRENWAVHAEAMGRGHGCLSNASRISLNCIFLNSGKMIFKFAVSFFQANIIRYEI